MSALARGDSAGVNGLLVSDAFLKENVNAGNYAILSGTLLPKNRKVATALLEISQGQEITLLKWTPGTPSLTSVGQSIFTNQISLMSSGTLEISLGEFPVELELRQAVKKQGKEWQVMEIVIKS